MSLRRYNRLRKRGYQTIGGTNWDNEFGDEWVVLIMCNGAKIKRVKVKDLMTVREFMEFEDKPQTNCSEKANSSSCSEIPNESQTNGDLVGGQK